MDIVRQIQEGKTSIGIELGSTRVKAVIIGEDYSPIASGAYNWNNRIENGVWTYSLNDVWKAMQSCFMNLSDNIFEKYGVVLETTSSIGISAMMHGYLPFDKNDELLVPFRTWRNTMTEEASSALTEAFQFSIPQRWSIAHLYQAILKEEPHVSQLSFLTTLAGYVHWQLTGQKVLGIGDASGMFPIDPNTKEYNLGMAHKFSELTAEYKYDWNILNVLPKIIGVGECAGKLTERGARLLDPTGKLKAGISLCPPEGDAETGMVATNSIAPKTGNVSAGTSIFAMAVLEHDLSSVYKEIDIVATPCGSPVAMVHCNNCTTDLDAWVNMFCDALKTFGFELPKAKVYDMLYEAALTGKTDCGGLLTYNYFSGEHVTGLTEGRPLLVRTPESEFSVANLMRSLVYSCIATLKIGMDILLKQEKVTLEKMLAHGGLFKSSTTGQSFLAAALEVPVALMESAGEGGAWGIALLAAYHARADKNEQLAEFLNNRVFTDLSSSCLSPVQDDVSGFVAYMEKFKAGLAIEKTAVSLNLK